MSEKKILVINPNTSSDMTKTIELAAKSCADPRTQIDVMTNTVGPLSIEGVFEEVLTTPSILEVMIQEENNYDAFVIACFSAHPAVNCGREAISKPVLGIFESACLLCCLLGSSFSVVTSSARWEPLLDEGIRQIGLESRSVGTISSGLSVRDLEEKSQEEVTAILVEAGRKAVKNRGAEVICLGCAGMAGLSEKLESELHVPVIDPVSATLKLAEALVYQGLSTSKAGAFQPLEPRETTGLSPVLASVFEEV